MSISAWYLLKRRHEEFARRSFTGALILATVSSLAIAVSGDFQAKNVYRHQPAKLAAFEGLETTGPAGLAIAPGVEVPGLLSWLLHGDASEPVLGLDAFRPEHRPPVAIPLATYRIMVGIGFFFVALTLVASWLRWRGALFSKRWLLWVFILAVVPAVLGNQAGWVAAEVGRQPWIVHPRWVADENGAPALDAGGFVRYETVTIAMPDGTTRETYAGLLTTDGVSEAVVSEQVLGSILLFTVVYLLLGALWIFVLNRKIQAGPGGEPRGEGGLLEAAASRPTHREA
jgi:cytochrome d ubiquinol oxidase subunit I